MEYFRRSCHNAILEARIAHLTKDIGCTKTKLRDMEALVKRAEDKAEELEDEN